MNRVEAAAYGDLALPMLETRGAEGLVFDGTATPGHPVEVVSTHGAGDVFLGALAAEVVRGIDLVDALTFAQAAAAWHVSAPLDARPRLTREAVMAFLEDQVRR